MSPRTPLLSLLVAVALLLPAAGFAAKSQTWKFAVDTPTEFEAQAAEVRKEMNADGKYGAISVDDRKAVENDLERIDELLTTKGSLKAMSDKDKVEIMNAQERINAVLTKNDGNRLICTMEQRTGTKFKQKVCKTALERDEMRRRSQESFQDDMMRGGASQAKGN